MSYETFDEHLDSLVGNLISCDCCHGEVDDNDTNRMACNEDICHDCETNETRVSDCCVVPMPLGCVCPDCKEENSFTYVVHPNPLR